MSRRSVAAAVLLIAAAGPALPATASATFPGQNGAIAYTQAKYDKNAKAYGYLGQGALFTISANATGLFAFPDDERSNDSEPAWSADGTRLAYARQTNGKQNGIVVGSLDTWNASRLIARSNSADMPAFSPDGQTIIYSEYGKGIYTVPANGTAKPTLLVRNAKGWLNLGPSYSPDGSTVVFSRYKTTNSPKRYSSEIWAVDASGANPRVVVGPDANHLYPDAPDISPDGTKLVFAASTSEGRPAIWTSALDGSATNVLVVAAGTNYLASPVWSPDGKKIAATLLKPTLKKGSALVTIDTAGGTLTTVRRVTKALVASPNWQPLPAAPPVG